MPLLNLTEQKREDAEKAARYSMSEERDRTRKAGIA